MKFVYKKIFRFNISNDAKHVVDINLGMFNKAGEAGQGHTWKQHWCFIDIVMV